MTYCKKPTHWSKETKDEDETTVRHAKHGRRLKEKAEMKGMKRGWRESKMAEDRDEDNGKDDGYIARGSGVWCVECGVWSLACGVWSVWSVECGVCGMWSVECVECGVWSVECGVWSVLEVL